MYRVRFSDKMDVYVTSSSTDRLTVNTKPRDDCLGWLHVITLINGLKLRARQSVLLTFLFKLVFIAYNYFHVVKNLYEFEFNAESVRKIIYISVHLTAIISHHYFARKRDEIRQMFKSIAGLLQKLQRDEIRCAARGATVIWSIGVAWGFSSGKTQDTTTESVTEFANHTITGLLRWYRYGTAMFLKDEYLIVVPNDTQMKLMYDLCVAADIIIFNIVSIGWYLGSVCIYGYFVYSIGKLNEVYFNFYAEMGVVESRSHFRSMRCVWVSITNIKNQFDELFSIQVRQWHD